MAEPDGPKTIVTHKKPHLDEVVASWMLRRFDPELKDCRFEFYPYRPDGGGVPTGPSFVALGIGRGKYDEHGMQAGHSATQLVFKDLQHRGLMPSDRHADQALTWLVDYTHSEDTAQWSHLDPIQRSFSLPAMFRGLAINNPDDPSQKIMTVGLELIDAIFAQLNELAKFTEAWEERIEFDTVWGRGVGLHTDYRGSDAYAYHQGYVLRVQTDPTKPYGDFRAPANSSVDLTEIYNKLAVQEPKSWFLHQSHRILVSNIDPATRFEPTKLNLTQLIDLVKK